MFGFTSRLRVLTLVTWEHTVLDQLDWLDVGYVINFSLMQGPHHP